MNKLLSKINSVSAALASAVMLFVMFSISYSVIVRSFGLRSPIWILQFNEYGLVWICFLATAWVLAENKHVRVDILFNQFGPKGQGVLLLIQNVVSTAACAVCLYYTSLSTWEHIRDRVMDIQSVDVPKGWILIVIPFGFLLLTLQFIHKTIEDGRALKKPSAVDAAPLSANAMNSKEVEG